MSQLARRHRLRTMSTLSAASSWTGGDSDASGAEDTPTRPALSDEEAWGLLAQVTQADGEWSYACRECGASYSKRSRLRRHLRRHTGNRPYVCPKPGCGSAFRRRDHMQRHVDGHSGERPHECDVAGCGARFVSRSHLLRHVRLHSVPKPHACDSCAARFAKKIQLARHKVREHGAAEPYKCEAPFCGKTYMREVLYLKHKALHGTGHGYR